MKTLVVYYSLSGTTRAVATALAKELGADLEEIRCKRYAPGFSSALRAGYDSWRGNLPPIEPLSRAPSRYGLVVVGGLAFSQVVTLFVTPGLFLYMQAFQEKVLDRFELTRSGSSRKER